MGKGLFVTATGTDIGKTYVSALIVKKLREHGYKAGYYKAALSGSDSIEKSDAGYVKRISGTDQPDNTLLSYLYPQAVSPHLAAKLENRAVSMENIVRAYSGVSALYDYVTVEGSGGIVCPLRWDAKEKILLEDVIQAFGIPALIVADPGLGTINTAVLTAEYMKNRKIDIKGFILNNYAGGRMQEDNAEMIEALTGISVIARIERGAGDLEMRGDILAELYG